MHTAIVLGVLFELYGDVREVVDDLHGHTAGIVRSEAGYDGRL